MILGQIISGITVASIAVFIGILVYLVVPGKLENVLRIFLFGLFFSCRWILSGKWIEIVIEKVCLAVMILIGLFAVFGVVIAHSGIIFTVAAVMYIFIWMADPPTRYPLHR